MTFPSVADLFHERYRLDEVLGKGGFSTVFAAVDVVSGRRVALKILRPGPDGYSPDVESRFTREVRVIANLRDPHTVTMYDFGTSAEGLLFMVFEHVPGMDLSELLHERGKLDEPAALHVLRQVLHSLSEAHSAGLLHRDIKPENLRIYEYGGDPLRVKLLDFGIARPRSFEGPQITRPGEIVGTPRYMSPEQLLDQPLTAASDLYSLGLVTIEMLAGVATSGNNWGDQVERLKVGYVFGAALAQEISPGLQAILTRMTARDPAARYQDARDVLRDLDELAAAAHAPPRREPTAGTSQERRAPARARAPEQITHELPPASRPTRALALAALAGCLTVVVVVLIFARSEPQTVKRTAVAPAHALLRGATQPAAPPAAARPVPGPPDLGPDISPPPRDWPRSAGCGNPAPTHGSVQLKRLEGLQTVTYDVYLPAGYDPDTPSPSLLVFHDAAVEPLNYIRDTHMTSFADHEGVVLLLPRAETVFDGSGAYGRVWERASDLEAVHELWETATEQLCLDHSRVYAFGQAAGGYAVERLPCEFPVTAIATNAHIKVPNDAYCTPRHPVPYILFVGNKDRYVPEQGGPNCALNISSIVEKLSWEETAERWRENNRTSPQGRPYGPREHGSCTRWAGDAAFVLCRMEGGRELSGTPPRIWDLQGCAGEPSEFAVLETMWAFFEEAPAREATTVSAPR